MNNFDCCESKLPFCSLMVKLYSFGVILSLLFSIFIWHCFRRISMSIIYSPPIWYLYLSLIFIWGFSKVNISDLKLCMFCRPSCSYWCVTHFLVSPREWWATFWGLMESSAWLQETVCCTMLMERLPELPLCWELMLGHQLWVLCFPPSAPVGIHLCHEFLPAKRFLGCACWVLFSLLPQWAWCSSLAVAIEITEPYRYLWFSFPLWKALRPLYGLSGWASCIIPNVSAPCRGSSLPCRPKSCVLLSWDGQLSHCASGSQQVHSSGGHWTSK